MKKIMYVPFSEDWELLRDASHVVNSHNSFRHISYFDEKIYYPVPSNTGLAHVMPRQELYIVAHGALGSPFIYDSTNKKMSLHDLGRQLIAQQLNKSISKIKLFSCESGSALSTNKSAAYQLYVALVTMGFNKIKVYGYDAVLTSDKMAELGDEDVTPWVVRKSFSKLSRR